MKNILPAIFCLSLILVFSIPGVVFAQTDLSTPEFPASLSALTLTAGSVSSCVNEPPQSSPDLLQINTASDSATLYFAQTKDQNSGYIINYGYKADNAGFMAGFIPDKTATPEAVISHTIDGLYPNTNYYFKVMAINGCASGPWSNIINTVTEPASSSQINIVYQGIISIVNDTILISNKGKNLLTIPLPFAGSN